MKFTEQVLNKSAAAFDNNNTTGLTHMTMPLRRTLLASALGLLMSGAAQAADSDQPSWDVMDPPFDLNEVTISTNQTTWSSLSVSPDGQYMVFDILFGGNDGFKKSQKGVFCLFTKKA